jgi:crotonobetainyl-CoA:carnitine CoA-transferase CaiB-like acyl-CoA transferase
MINKDSLAAGKDDQTPGPFSGIKVLDLSGYIAGPFGCTLLADLGAEVIKIEAPQGDTLHKYPSTLEQEGRAFLGVNRSKLGLVLDLKQPEGLAVLLRLVETADVLVHNFRPAVPRRLGIDYDRLKEINLRLIYCAVTGYGDTGPLKDKAGYDQVLQSMTGICSFQGLGKGKPEIAYGSIVDYYAASMLAYGVSSALFNRERTGKGQSVGVSLLRSALTMQSARFIWAESEGREVERDMRSGGITGIHPTKEGSLYISANTPHFWSDLCELTGLSALATDPRYDTVRKRAQFAAEIVPKLHAALQARTALEWEEIFGERVPCAAVRPIEDMFDHPQVLAEEMVTTLEHPLVGRYKGMGKPIKFSDTPGPAPFAAPVLGQHSAAVLAKHGYSEQEIARLAELGVIQPAAKQK